MKYIKKFGERIINESKKENFLSWVPFSKSNRPKSDLDIKENKNIIREAVRKFDIMFGTDYFDKFGMDYHILTGTQIYYAKEVIESLTDESLRSEVYNKFDLVTKKEDSQKFLYDYLMTMLMGEECETETTTLFINKKIPLKVTKSELLYKFFKKFGKEFNNDLIKSIFDIKNSYDLGGNGNQMSPKIQKSFLESLKMVLDKYETKGSKGVKKVMTTSIVFNLALEDFFGKESLESDKIKEQYLKKRLNDWFKWIKNNLI